MLAFKLPFGDTPSQPQTKETLDRVSYVPYLGAEWEVQTPTVQ